MFVLDSAKEYRISKQIDSKMTPSPALMHSMTAFMGHFLPQFVLAILPVHSKGKAAYGYQNIPMFL